MRRDWTGKPVDIPSPKRAAQGEGPAAVRLVMQGLGASRTEVSDAQRSHIRLRPPFWHDN